MTKMDRPQVLNDWDEAGQCFGNTAMLLDVQAPFHHVMKANRRRKPFLPLRVSKHSHLNRFRLQLLEQSRDSIEISFSNTKTEFALLAYLSVSPPVLLHGRCVQFCAQQITIVRRSILKKRPRVR